MINNITTVYFTDESEYISSSGPLLKYSEQANIIKQSMVSDDKIIADSFKDSESKPFGTLLNFFFRRIGILYIMSAGFCWTNTKIYQKILRAETSRFVTALRRLWTRARFSRTSRRCGSTAFMPLSAMK
ncbi:MAG: hypothetical protein K2J73_05815 [Oscillospiraceae bacterium]|nr:hypothetical protein [Oscillospiraceae bacterium]